MKQKVAIAILLLLVVVGGLAGVRVLQVKKMIAAGKSFATPPETVSSVVATEETWQGVIPSIGSISAFQGVTITPEIPGLVREIAFEPGGVVAKGDLLVRMDVSSEEAQLRGSEAQVELARVNLDRVRKLRADTTVSQAELDSADALFKQNQANSDSIRATIDKKTIRAPFAGRLGIRLVNVGQYLEAGKPIVSLQALDPVYADFALPQQELGRLKVGMRVRVTTDAYVDTQFPGILTTINPDLDAGTRSVNLQATLTNSTLLLRPGMFARVEVLLPEEHKVLVIPATAVLSAPYGDSIYLIESKAAGTNGTPQLTVRQQFIRAGQARGDMLSVISGLKPGERIVGSGLFKLRNGMAVVENNTLAPKSELKPNPPER